MTQTNTNSIVPTAANVTPAQITQISQGRRARSDIAAIRASLIVPSTCFMTREGVPARVLEVVRNPTSIKLSCEYVSDRGTKVRVRSLDSVVNQLASFLPTEEFQVKKLEIERARGSIDLDGRGNMPVSSFPPPSGQPLDVGAELQMLRATLTQVMDRIERIENSTKPTAPAATEPAKA